MNDQSQMMNQAQMMAAMNQPPPPMMMMNQMGQSSQPPPKPMMMANQSQPPLPMMNLAGGYKLWPQPQPQPQPQLKPNFPGRNNWKGKKAPDHPRRVENLAGNLAPSAGTGGAGVGGGGYKPPTLHELQSQNRLKARKFYPKKKFNNHNNNNNNNRFKPYAPRNTTSYIIRAKKSGGIASLVSPCPVTPAVLPTPIFSPSREVLGDMAKEEWGVDGYGSMKGLIRLRSPGNDDDDEEDGGGGSGESDVEEHVEVERRLDHDLSRFEMIYPNNYNPLDYNNMLENRVDDQDSHIAQLEDENLTLKERLFLMEREMGDLRRRLLFLERQSHVAAAAEPLEVVVENESENESEGCSGKNNNNNNEDEAETDPDRSHRDVCMGDSEQPREEDEVNGEERVEGRASS